MHRVEAGDALLPVHRHAIELALQVLIEAADADIADALSV